MTAPTAPAAARTSLDDIPLLAPLPAQVKGELMGWMQKRAVNVGEIIFNEGEAGDAMYIIESGYVSVFVNDAALGLTVDVASLGKGEAFGEMALVTGEGRKASVKALEPTTLLVLTRDVFFRLVQAVPQVGLTLAATLARRLDALNRTQRVAFGSLRNLTVPDEVKALVPPAVVARTKMAPIAHAGGVVTLACVDPQNRVALDEMKRLLRGMDIKLMATAPDDFERYLLLLQASTQRVQQAQAKNYAQLAKGGIAFAGGSLLGSAGDDAQKLQAASASNDVVELLNQLIYEGIDRGASDIHIEPERSAVVVRYRIDGRLKARAGEIPLSALNPLVSRCKAVASLNIAERRLPQDGRISLKMGQKNYDLRIATVNTKNGEKIVMRVLDPSSLQADLSSLILAEKVCTAVRSLFYRADGLVLVTGPTGSGKSTTLYSAIAERRNPEISIATIEDPIEYSMDGVTQAQTNEAAGLTFASIMRTYLRQDPNLILVGEMRDTETARLACNAALTGHLVISSFHTNDAISAVQRLRSMELDNHLIAGSLLGVINQRLVRRLCPACRAEAPVTDLVMQNLARSGVVLDARVKLYRSVGCPQCSNEGFKGRAGVYELLVMSAAVKDAVARGAPAHEIRVAAEQGAYVSLARYAAFLLQEGITIPSEILRILPKTEAPLKA